MSAVKAPPEAAFTQLVGPNLGTQDATGMCLRFAQSVFGAPVAHKSATVAANHTKFRHHTRTLPNVAAIVWLDHYGTYGDPPTRDNWGHVVAWVPGYGLLSSPASGYGQQWFPSIDAVERAFNAKFRFWTEDINGLRVAEPAHRPTTPISPEEDDDMAQNVGIYYMDGAKQINAIVNTGSGYFGDYQAEGGYNNFVAAGFATGSFVKVTQKHFEAIKRQCGEVRAGK